MKRSALIIAVLFLASCKSSEVQAPPLGQRQILESFSLSESSRGRPAWSLEARLAFLNAGSRKLSLEEPRLSFFKDGSLFSSAQSKTGAADIENRELFLSNSVVVKSIKDKTTLKTEGLVYSDKIKKFSTDLPVVLSRPDAVVRGSGLMANADLSELRIYHQESVVTRPQ